MELHDHIVDSPEYIKQGYRIGIDFALSDWLACNWNYNLELEYNDNYYSFNFYYPKYLDDQNAPLYYDIYLYPDRDYFRGDSSQIAWIVTTKTPKTANSTEPLLMIEGTYPKSDYWPDGNDIDESYRQIFETNGGYDVFQFNYPSLQNIRYSAALLGEVTKDIQKRYYNGSRKFNVLTHSQGGLVARAYTVGMGVYNEMEVNYENEFKSIVQIAPPNHGGYYIYAAEYEEDDPDIAGSIADVFLEFDVPATKMQSCGSKFLWELNSKGLNSLQNNESNRGYIVVAGTNQISSLIQSSEMADGVLSVASASLLSFGNIPLVLLPSNHKIRDFDLQSIYNLANIFIVSGYNSDILVSNIGSSTDNQGIYVDSNHLTELQDGGEAEDVWGSLELKVLEDGNEIYETNSSYGIQSLVLYCNESRKYFRMKINNNNSPEIDDLDEVNDEFDNIGPSFAFPGCNIYRKFILEHVYRGTIYPGTYNAYLKGRLQKDVYYQTWTITAELGQTVHESVELDIPDNWVTYVAACPVDLQIIDPNGFVIDTANSAGDNWIYYHDDINNDGEIDHIIDIADPIEGNYTINVIPHDTASEYDSFSVYIETESSIDTLVDNQLIGNNELFSYDHTLDSPLDASENGNTDNIPTDFMLNQNYPNPFNPSTTIEYSLPTRSNVNISVYNILGRKVTTLINKNQTAGNHSVTWNGANNQNQQVSSGIYFYRIETNDFTTTKKMTLLK